MNRCGFWAHCAHHCDLPCEHDEWCPDFPGTKTPTLPTPHRMRLSVWLRALLGGGA